ELLLLGRRVPAPRGRPLVARPVPRRELDALPRRSAAREPALEAGHEVPGPAQGPSRGLGSRSRVWPRPRPRARSRRRRRRAVAVRIALAAWASGAVPRAGG